MAFKDITRQRQMHSSAKFIVMVMALVFLLTSPGGFGFHSKEFVHDLDHHRQLQVQLSAFEDMHADIFTAGSNAQTPGDAADPAEEVAHQLLHALGTVHLVTSSPANFSWNLAAHLFIQLPGNRRLPLALPESPFRPPRSSAFA